LMRTSDWSHTTAATRSGGLLLSWNSCDIPRLKSSLRSTSAYATTSASRASIDVIAPH